MNTEIINTIMPKAQLPKYRRDMKESAGETQYGDVMARTQQDSNMERHYGSETRALKPMENPFEIGGGRSSAQQANARNMQAMRQKRGLVKFSRLMATDTEGTDESGVADTSKSMCDMNTREIQEGFDIKKARKALKTPMLSESMHKINKIDNILSRVNSILVQKQYAQSEFDVSAHFRRIDLPH